VAEVVTSIRVALVGCSGLLGEIIAETVASQPDFEVVADLAAPEPGADPVNPDLEVDIVLWNDADEAGIAHWMNGFRRRCPRVLGTLIDGRNAALWELVPRRTELGELSPNALVETIRDPRAADR
jgi:hypothetical protein